MVYEVLIICAALIAVSVLAALVCLSCGACARLQLVHSIRNQQQQQSYLQFRIGCVPPYVDATSSSAKKKDVVNIGLVIAHPDDESMFFLPTISACNQSQELHQQHPPAVFVLHVLCLSTGNSAGLGTVRQKEMHRACEALHIPQDRITVVHDELQLADGMRTHWSPAVVQSHVNAFVEQYDIQVLLTFDDYGVSGHANHCATYAGVKQFISASSSSGYKRKPLQPIQHAQQTADSIHRKTPATNVSAPVIAYRLISTNLFRKYIGVVDILLSLFECCFSAQKLTAAADSASYAASGTLDARHTARHMSFTCQLNVLRSYRCMALHASQWVWYRKLFVCLSRFTFVNTWQQIVAE